LLADKVYLVDLNFQPRGFLVQLPTCIFQLVELESGVIAAWDELRSRVSDIFDLGLGGEGLLVYAVAQLAGEQQKWARG
jgi:hypothetical protein